MALNIPLTSIPAAAVVNVTFEPGKILSSSFAAIIILLLI